ncbi:MAG: alpha-ketoglutarate-dependent dioxygenase AlkB [Methyloligellaceae bacterium]
MIKSGFEHLQNYYDRTEQMELVEDVRKIISQAPLFVPTMPNSGKPFSVRMTNCGSLGWVSDKTGGYRYQDTHPVTGNPWPDMPEIIVKLWEDLASDYPKPECCLVNYYQPDAKMGLHRDADEEDTRSPVISVSLGDTASFRIGGKNRKDPTRSLRLNSGDIVVLGVDMRLAYHGIDRILKKDSGLLTEGGRFNLTLRRVNNS